MPRPRNAIPTYRQHRQSGQAVVTLRLPDGRRRDVLLGPYGSEVSQAEYQRVLAEWRAAGGGAGTPSGLTVNELLVAYWRHVESYYRDPDGRPTSERHCLRAALRPVRELYGYHPAAEFGPIALKAVRDRLVAAGGSRGTVNKHVHRIKRAFRWAVAQELVPASVYHGLQAVAGLARGRSPARETEPVKPVPEPVVAAVLPFVLPPVAAMVELQRLTGMRPGEVCRVRACDVDVSGAVWLYRPARHKTQHLGRERVIPIGPRAQAVLKPFLTLSTQAYLFSPVRADEEWRAAKRAARRTKVYPSEHGRRKGGAPRRLGERYATRQYAQAVERGCDRAFPPPADLARGQVPGGRGRPRWETPAEWRARLGEQKWAELAAWRRGHRWHPNQLRHTHATEVRRRFGLEAAQVVLGHTHANVTQLYAQRDLALALKVAAAVG
jgi:integrase